MPVRLPTRLVCQPQTEAPTRCAAAVQTALRDVTRSLPVGPRPPLACGLITEGPCLAHSLYCYWKMKNISGKTNWSFRQREHAE